MRKVFLTVSLLLCLLLPAGALAEGDAVSGDNLLYNSDFSVSAEGAALPAGWELEAYLSAADEVSVTTLADDSFGACVRLRNLASNDARIVQSVEVEPETLYRITAAVRTEEVSGELGASISIDNFSIDGSYCYSEDLSGSAGWKELALYVRTAPEQTKLRVALRLGGYSMQCEGTAYFADVAMYRCKNAGNAAVIDLANQSASSGASSEVFQGMAAGDAHTPLISSLTVSLLVAAFFALLYWRVFRYEADMLPTPAQPHMELCAILVGALVLRIALSLIFVGHSTDINCFMAWGNAMLNGPENFYTSGMFADYPPGYMYVCGALAALARLLHLSYGSAGYVLLFKLPATLADIGAAYFIYRLAKKRGSSEAFSLILAALVALNPAGAFISGAWGQIDSVLSLGLMLVCYLLLSDKRILAGALYGLVLLFKPQALMLGPIIAAAYIVDIIGPRWKPRLLKTILAVLSAVAVLFLLSLPFKSTQDFGWLIEKYLSTTGSYAYASIEAFNFPALLGGNWAPVSEKLLGLPYNIWGTVFIVLAIVLSVYAYCRSRSRHAGALYLCGAFMLAMIFTFGHYMHERYLFPVLLLLLMAYVYERDRRLLISFGWFTATLLFNAVAAMYIVDHQSARGALYDALVRVGSAAQVLGFLYLGYISFRILLQDRTALPLKLQKKKKAEGDSNAPRTILPVIPTDTKLRYTRKDCVLLLLLVLVYGAVALFHLGTTKAPETYWETEELGETVTVAFDKPVAVSEYWVYCNIGDPSVNHSGTMLLRAGDAEMTYEQGYDNMFRWQRFPADFTASAVELQLYSGRLKLNEIAFFDDKGSLIPARVLDPEGSQACLLDEQDTVPDAPSCYNGMYFDELYHARTAYEHLHGLKPYENSHPPLGKLLIALGIAVFGMNPFGWRIVGTLIGIAMLPVLYAFGKRMFRKTEYAFVLTALFAFDFMHFTQTRIATIDVYAVFFILLMYYFMYRYITMNFFVDGLKKTLRPLALSGLFFGIGAASKWICIYAGGGLAVLFFGSLIARYHEYSEAMEDGTKQERASVSVFYRNTLATLLWCVLFFIIVPFSIYFLSYLPYYAYEASQTAEYGISNMWNTFWNYQDFMYSYHSGLDATHPYQSSWWQWPFTLRPMWYYFGGNADGSISTLTASGNPAVWWVSAIGALVLLVQRATGRVKKDRALQIICVGVLANFLPWVLISRCTFIYHFFATVPFLLMAAVYALHCWEERTARVAWVKWVWLAVALLLFIALYPGISGYPVSAEWASIIKHFPGGGLMYGA